MEALLHGRAQLTTERLSGTNKLTCNWYTIYLADWDWRRLCSIVVRDIAHVLKVSFLAGNEQAVRHTIDVETRSFVVVFVELRL